MYKLPLLFCLFANIVMAYKPIPEPDMSQSEVAIVNTHKHLLKTFNESKDEVDNIQLGAAYGKLGMFYQAHEFTNSAKVCYENAVEASPFDFRWSHLLGFINATLGDFDSARANYKKVLEINSEYLPAKIRWAEIEVESGNFLEAEKLYKEVLDLAPEFTKAIAGLGTIKMQTGEYEAALGYFKKALNLQPKANQLNFLISQAYSAMGDQEQALSYQNSSGLRSVVMYDKILQEMRLNSVSSSYYSQAAINAFMNDDYKLSEELVNHSIRLAPDNVNPYFTLINILVATGRIEEAVLKASELLKKNPADDRIAYTLGVINEIKGNDKKASEWYGSALNLNKKHKFARLSKAKALMRLGEYQQALLDLRAAQNSDSENPYLYYAEASILSYLKVCDKAVDKYLEAIQKSADENFRYLIGFVKTVSTCDKVSEQIRFDAMNAARNMYRFNPVTEVVQALAMIEAGFGNKDNAVDFQAQAIFQALSEKRPETYIGELKEDLERYKKGLKSSSAIKSTDIALNPERAISVK